jgi:predicted nucleic acid-binding protein
MSEVELFSFSHLTEKEIQAIDSILATLSIIPLDSQIAQMAGFIRRTHRLKVPDSVIAATALFTGSILVTKDTHDFKRIEHLKLLEW